MKRLDEILLARALAFKHDPNEQKLVDAAIDETGLPTITKNICAHLPMPLVDRLENALSVLQMSKREFITDALIDSLDRYDAIMSEYGVWEEYERKHGPQAEEAA